MKIHFLFLFLFFFLVITPSVIAQPPFQQEVELLKGYVIDIPEQGVLKVNRDFTFFFHLFNISNGLPLSSSEASCEMNLHDDTSKLIFTNNELIFNLSSTSFSQKILAGNFTKFGEYTYVTHCNSSDFGGAISVGFIVSADGLDIEKFPKQFTFIIIGLLLIFSSFYFERLRMFKHLGSIILIGMGILTLFPGYGFVNWTTLFGKFIGFITIAFGIYFLIEDSFGRGNQDDRFMQDGEDD